MDQVAGSACLENCAPGLFLTRPRVRNMTGFRLSHTDVKPLTADLALSFRDMQPSQTEREINPRRLKHLRQKADAGCLVAFHWAIAEIGGQIVRVNGQHSSNMLCQMDGSFPDGLTAVIETYDVDDNYSLALLFKQFDDRKSSR